MIDSKSHWSQVGSDCFNLVNTKNKNNMHTPAARLLHLTTIHRVYLNQCRLWSSSLTVTLLMHRVPIPLRFLLYFINIFCICFVLMNVKHLHCMSPVSKHMIWLGISKCTCICTLTTRVQDCFALFFTLL